MKREKNYIVKLSNTHVEDQEFAWIGDTESLNTWMGDGSLQHGDLIYEATLIGEIKEKKELELIKTK